MKNIGKQKIDKEYLQKSKWQSHLATLSPEDAKKKNKIVGVNIVLLRDIMREWLASADNTWSPAKTTNVYNRWKQLGEHIQEKQIQIAQSDLAEMINFRNTDHKHICEGLRLSQKLVKRWKKNTVVSKKCMCKDNNVSFCDCVCVFISFCDFLPVFLVV